VPLGTEDCCIGVLGVARKSRAAPFDAAAMQLVELFAERSR
jgi:hypothetical protein